MRINEIILETTLEDRKIISLSSEIIDKILKNQETGKLGKISDYTETALPPVLAKTSLQIVRMGSGRKGQLDLSPGSRKHLDVQEPGKQIDRYFNDVYTTISLDIDEFYKDNRDFLISVLAHEIRHVFDFINSKGKAYFSSSEKRMQSNYSSKHIGNPTAYQGVASTKSEINARVQQSIHDLTTFLDEHRDYKFTSAQIAKLIHKFLDLNRIKDLFPGGTNDRYYRRIFNRLHSHVINR